MGEPCVGCEGPLEDAGAVTLWLDAPLGMCAVRIHRARTCAEAARAKRGGGRFRKDGPPVGARERMLLDAEAARKAKRAARGGK